MDTMGYRSAWEFYNDAWERLDLYIILAMKRMEASGGTADPALQAFKGLVLTEEEMYGLLFPKANTEEDPEIRKLEKLIASKEIEIEKSKKATGPDVFLPMSYIAEVFGLDAFEEQVVLMALAQEVDRKYAKLYAYLHDDATMKYITPELAIRLGHVSETGAEMALGYLMPESKLQTWMLRSDTASASASGGGPLLLQPLKLDERITAFLLGEGYTDSSLEAFIKLYEAHDEVKALEAGEELQKQLRAYLQAGPREKTLPVFCLWGGPGAGKKLQARHAAAYLGRPLLIVDIEAALRDERPFEELLRRILREAMLHGAFLAFDRFQRMLAEDEGMHSKRNMLMKLIGEAAGPVFLLSDRAWNPQPLRGGKVFIETELPFPDSSTRKRLWETFSRDRGMADAADWPAIAGKFRLNPGQIAGALDYAKHLAGWENGDPEAKADEKAIHKACYAHMQHNLKRKAVRVEARYGWEQVVLPPEQKEQLVHACARLKHRQLVFGEWGFDRALAYGKGTSLLFAGPPGTGKTMCAQVIASDLQLELYRIDLSQVISKYIGETEKNLHEIFTEASQSGAILFFDEADALFGKRSEVKDSHDKYANVETAYLLQKMEEYEGITILATNLLNNLDEAFMRRFGFIVKFPFPDIAHRERLWRSMFPPEAPVDADIDYRFLAEKFEMAGGLIKNVVVSAAFLAAETGTPIEMKHVLMAARSEMRKNGKLLLPADLGEYAELLK